MIPKVRAIDYKWLPLNVSELLKGFYKGSLELVLLLWSMILESAKLQKSLNHLFTF